MTNKMKKGTVESLQIFIHCAWKYYSFITNGLKSPGTSHEIETIRSLPSKWNTYNSHL